MSSKTIEVSGYADTVPDESASTDGKFIGLTVKKFKAKIGNHLLARMVNDLKDTVGTP